MLDDAQVVGRLPLESFDDLLAVIGGETVIAVGTDAVPLEQCRSLIPMYYFPIVSLPDLHAKLDDLAAIRDRVSFSVEPPAAATLADPDAERSTWS